MSASQITSIDRGSVHLQYGKEAERYASASTSKGCSLLKTLFWAPYKTAMMIATVANIKWYPNVPRMQQIPEIQRWFEKAAYCCGLNDTQPYISEIHFPDYPWYNKEVSLLGYSINIYLPKPPVVTAHLSNHEALSRAILEPHRLEAFSGARGMNNIIGILEKIFPGLSFDTEDVMFTCSASFTQKIHAALAKAFRHVKMDKIILDEGQMLINRWKQKEESFDVTAETQIFTSNVILKTLFGGNWDVSKEVHFMNGYFFSKATKTALSTDEVMFGIHCKKFNQVINEILELDLLNDFPLFEGFEFTKAQKCALIFSLFFAGQETSAFALDHIFAYLALNPKEQEDLYETIKGQEIKDLMSIPELREFVDNRLLEIPPVAGVGRESKDTTVLSFEVNGKKIEKIIRQGEIVGAGISEPTLRLLLEKKANASLPIGTMLHNKANVFGKGRHICQGMSLALKEIFILPFLVLSHFKLKTDEEKFSYGPKFTNQADPFLLKVSKR